MASQHWQKKGGRDRVAPLTAPLSKRHTQTRSLPLGEFYFTSLSRLLKGKLSNGYLKTIASNKSLSYLALSLLRVCVERWFCTCSPPRSLCSWCHVIVSLVVESQPFSIYGTEKKNLLAVIRVGRKLQVAVVPFLGRQLCPEGRTKTNNLVV